MTALTGVSAIMVRELRGRMRSRKAFIFLTFYLAILAGLFYLSMRGMGTEERLFGALEAASLGKGLFIAVILIETLVVAALAPAYTAGAISQEREKQTYDLLVVTPITSLSIAVGKLMSGLAYLLILVLASIPVASLGFFFGGVEPTIFLPAYLVLIAGAIGLGSVGVFFSALLKRTQPASIATYLCLVAGTVGSLFGGALWYRLTDDQASRPPEALFYFTPYFAQADVFCELTADPGLCGSLPGRQARDNALAFGADGAAAFPAEIAATGSGFWVRNSLFWLGLAVVMLLGAARFISPTHPWRPGEAQPAHTTEAPG